MINSGSFIKECNLINPDQIIDYKNKLKENYKEDKKFVKNIFDKVLQNVDSCCVFLTGSHGRKEKLGSSSKYELIVVFSNNLSLEKMIDLQNKINSTVNSYPNTFDGIVEYKQLNKHSPLTYTETNNKENADGCSNIQQPIEKLIPTRVFDSMKVWGSNALKKAYYAEVYPKLQLLNNSSYTKFSKDFRQSTIRQLNNVIDNKNNPPQHLNPLSGKFIYDGENNKASKFPFLRTIQYQLAHVIFSTVRQKKIKEADFNELRKLRTITERLTWLSEKKFIKYSKEEIKSICDAYVISLIWYENAEIKFKQTGSTEMQVDLDQLKNVIKAVKLFIKP